MFTNHTYLPLHNNVSQIIEYFIHTAKTAKGEKYQW